VTKATKRPGRRAERRAGPEAVSRSSSGRDGRLVKSERVMKRALTHLRVMAAEPYDWREFRQEVQQIREKRALAALAARLTKEALAPPPDALDRAISHLEWTERYIRKHRMLGDLSREEALDFAAAQAEWAAALVEGRIQ
jgi:hypothetical protein